MSRGQYHKKVDANQPAIVKALRAIGCSVQSLASIGHGCPDLLVGYRGINYLLEVKDGTAKDRRQRELNDDEKKWFSNWNGDADLVDSVESALALIVDRKDHD